MNHSNKQNVSFVRLSSIPAYQITKHMSDPRMKEHMPLLTDTWSPARTTEFIEAKEASWKRDGLGHWAFLINGTYIGWGGFQKEGEEWDFALVLKAECFGMGPTVARQLLEYAKNDGRIPYVTFLLPPTRTKLAALQKLGARFITIIDYQGARFQKFQLETPNVARC